MKRILVFIFIFLLYMLDGYTDESTQRDINKTLGGKVILSYEKQVSLILSAAFFLFCYLTATH
jgi:hypothetical protein